LRCNGVPCLSWVRPSTHSNCLLRNDKELIEIARVLSQDAPEHLDFCLNGLIFNAKVDDTAMGETSAND
jgi:hypothetical protein